MPQSPRRLLLSFRGRISRSTFWWTVLSLAFVFVLLYTFLDATFGYTSTLLLYPPLFWALAAVMAKRMRDRGRSPAWLLVAIVPLLGPLWLLIELGLRRGTPDENHYGRDPLNDRPDYLTVR